MSKRVRLQIGDRVRRPGDVHGAVVLAHEFGPESGYVYIRWDSGTSRLMHESEVTIDTEGE